MVDAEVILVDDGSTDNSSKICDMFATKHSNIIVIHKKNGGLSDARNAGVAIAQGEYLLFVDGDDYIASNSLLEIKNVILENNKPDLIFLEALKFFDDTRRMIAMGDGIDEKVNKLRDREVYEYLADLPKYPASACTKAIKRKLFIENNLYFTKGLLSEDLEWCIRVLLAAKSFCYCPYKYDFYRQKRTGSISSTYCEKKYMDILSTFQKWTKNASTILSDAAKKRMIYSYMEYIFRFLLMGYSCVEKENRKAFLKCVKNGSWILGTRGDFPSKCINYGYKLLGIKGVGKALNVYLKIKRA